MRRPKQNIQKWGEVILSSQEWPQILNSNNQACYAIPRASVKEQLSALLGTRSNPCERSATTWGTMFSLTWTVTNLRGTIFSSNLRDPYVIFECIFIYLWSRRLLVVPVWFVLVPWSVILVPCMVVCVVWIRRAGLVKSCVGCFARRWQTEAAMRSQGETEAIIR